MPFSGVRIAIVLVSHVHAPKSGETETDDWQRVWLFASANIALCTRKYRTRQEEVLKSYNLSARDYA